MNKVIIITAPSFLIRVVIVINVKASKKIIFFFAYFSLKKSRYVITKLHKVYDAKISSTDPLKKVFSTTQIKRVKKITLTTLSLITEFKKIIVGHNINALDNFGI